MGWLHLLKAYLKVFGLYFGHFRGHLRPFLGIRNLLVGSRTFVHLFSGMLKIQKKGNFKRIIY
jgi:hypothetical protein